MRVLEGDERAEALAFGVGRCERCGLVDPDPVAVDDVGFPEIACRECAAALVPPEGDTHFVALVPELSQAAVSHLVRAVAVAAYGASGRCQPEHVLDLVRRGASHLAWADLVRLPLEESRSASEAREALKRAARDTFAALLGRERATRAAFGTSRPAEVAAIVAAMAPPHREEATRCVRVVPRRIPRSRVKSFETPIG